MHVFSGLDRAYGIYEITGHKNTATGVKKNGRGKTCLLYTSPSPRDVEESRMPSSA